MYVSAAQTGLMDSWKKKKDMKMGGEVALGEVGVVLKYTIYVWNFHNT